MAKATKILIVFDDGTTFETDASKVGSLYTSQQQAERCKHFPPYGKPPEKSGETSTMTTMAAEAPEEGSCYVVNGVVICP
jgi:hypothetical protein